MNNKGQGIGPVTFVFSILFTLVILSVAGGQIFDLWHLSAVGLTGVESFLMNNPEFFTLLALILGGAGFMYWGSR